jgi:beta-lactamase superfamily II metal-dependent hydrolase
MITFNNAKYFLEIKFFSVGCGDGILVRFLGEDSIFHNILIDGGTEKGDAYQNTIKKEIQRIIDSKEIIDLWIISHIDDDHIGGILRFIKDIDLRKQVDLSKTTFWYNYSCYDYDTRLKDSNLKSVSQAIRLRDFLKENTIFCESITNSLPMHNFFGAKITVLSPDSEYYSKLLDEWSKKEIQLKKKERFKLKTSNKKNDYETKLDDFDLTKFKEDNARENASSIAFLLSYAGKNMIFLADSLPSVIVQSLKEKGFSENNKLNLDVMQIAHHGSKFNTNDEILQLISCSNFVASADGFNKFNLPNKETFARIVKNKSTLNNNFFITCRNSLTKSIFKQDVPLTNTQIKFPDPGENSIIFTYSHE